MKIPFFNSEDKNRIVGYLATPSQLVKIDLEHDGYVLWGPEDERGRMAWPIGITMRTVVDLTGRGESDPTPYALLSGARLSLASLPGLQGYEPTDLDLRMAMQDRVARTKTAATSQGFRSDPLSTQIMIVAMGLVIVMCIGAIGMFAPRFAEIVAASGVNPMTVGIIIGGLALMTGIWLWMTRDRSSSAPAEEGSAKEEA